MKKIVAHLPYRLHLVLIIMCVAIVPLIFFSTMYLRGKQVKWKEDAMQEYSNVIAIGNEQLNSAILEMKQKSVYITSNISVCKALADTEKANMIEELEFFNLLRDTAAIVSADNNNMKVHWYSDKVEKQYAEYYRPLDVMMQDVSDDNLREQIMNLSAGNVFVTLRTVEAYGEGMVSNICVYAKMNAMVKGNYMLELCIPIDNVLNFKSDSAQVKISNLVFPEESIIGLQLIQEDNYSLLLSEETEASKAVWTEYLQKNIVEAYYEVAGDKGNTAGISLICLVPDRYVNALILGKRIEFAALMVLILLLVLLSVYATVVVFTVRLNGFLNRLNGKLNDILDLNYDEDVIEKDFEGIERKVLQLVQNTKEYCNELQKFENENSRLELELLQMRLNPHLLYNTLTCMRSQIQDATIRHSVDSLIRYYRIVLSKGHLNIRIEEEIKMIEEYLKIVKSTYQLSDLNIQFEVMEEAKNFMIVKHLLQPIVENAVEHGVRATGNVGSIWIRAKLSEHDVIFEIEDNGAGMTEEQMTGILKAPEYSSVGGGYGIYNVKQRIETYYGEEYGICFHSKLGEGTLVTLRIPQKI